MLVSGRWHGKGGWECGVVTAFYTGRLSEATLLRWHLLRDLKDMETQAMS